MGTSFITGISKSDDCKNKEDMKQRLYIDTSVFGGYYDVEFAEFTIPLFERLQEGEFTLLFSNATQDELENAPMKVKELVRGLKIENTEYIEISDEVTDLANEYIAEKVVGQTSYTDCLHIAAATINRADYLISWNFKHIVNVQRIRGYNSINIKNGYKELEIRSPRDFIKYEND
jgi:predicted nucleic acid-binding protein